MSTMNYVSVAIRIRPQLAQDENFANCLQHIKDTPPVLFITDKQQKSYSFDNVFTEDADQKDVFDVTVQPLIERVIGGFNCTVFAYGQTGTGKSYTVGTDTMDNDDEAHAGFISRAIQEFFGKPQQNMELAVSYFEIYNKKVYDLLDDNKVSLKVKGFQIIGLTKKPVDNSTHAQEFLKFGNGNRHIGSTKQNVKSSRSHAIFTIYCQNAHNNEETSAKINFVDLAGAEGVKKTGNVGSQFQEGVNINQGLLCIGQVISALSTNNAFIPYRDSMITTILQDSLNPKNFVTLIACVSPSMEDLNETTQTLDFAQKTKKVRRDPELNSIVQQYKTQNPDVLSEVTNVAKPGKRSNSFRVPQTPLRRNHSFRCSTLKRPRYASCLSNNDLVQQSVSPIVKRVLDAVENRIMSKFESLITERMVSMVNSTPQVPNDWKMNISRMIRDEVAQLDFPKSKQNGESAILKKCQDLYDSFGVSTSQMNDKTVLVEELSPIFKAPLPPRNIYKAKTPTRCSLRLSLKHNASIIRPLQSETTNKSRKSIRIAQKLNSTPAIVNRSRKLKRKSINASSIKDKFPKKIVPSFDDDSMENYVLRVLNEGSEKQLQELQCVGPKTAKQIYFYRKLNGAFKTLADVSKIPWRGISYQRFLSSNLVHVEKVE